MEKKYIISILLIIATLVIVGSFYFADFSKQNDNQIKVGEATFTVPDGYNVTNSSKDRVKLSNGVNSIGIVYYNSSKTNKYVDNYVSLKEEDGYKINVSNFTSGNTVVYKSEVSNDTGVVHYWFKYGEKTYSIYSGDANKHMDKQVSQLIKSVKENNK